MLPTRSNEDWLAALRSPEGGLAIAELETYLRRSLTKVLRASSWGDEDLADLVQDAMLKIVQGLDGFRGDSAFPTWAVAVATRAAFTALRRRAVRSRDAADFDEVREDALAAGPAVDDVVAERDLAGALRAAIDAELSERQRVAILAELRGIPTVEIAARLDTNTNALYKLVHDARRKLRTALESRGFGAELAIPAATEGKR